MIYKDFRGRTARISEALGIPLLDAAFFLTNDISPIGTVYPFLKSRAYSGKRLPDSLLRKYGITIERSEGLAELLNDKDAWVVTIIDEFREVCRINDFIAAMKGLRDVNGRLDLHYRCGKSCLNET